MAKYTKYTGKIHYLNDEKHFGYISVPDHKDIWISTQNCNFKKGDIVTVNAKTIRKKDGSPCEIAVSVQLKNETPDREPSDVPAPFYANEPDPSFKDETLPFQDQEPDPEILASFSDSTNDFTSPESFSLWLLIASAIEKSGKSCGIQFCDLRHMLNLDLTKPDNHWFLGKPEILLYVDDKIVPARVLTGKQFQRTISGGFSTVSDSNSPQDKGFHRFALPAYGCSSFFIDKELCLNMINFAHHSGLNLSFYHIIFTDYDKTGIYMLSLKQLQKLIESGYNNIPLGEYPGRIDSDGASITYFLLPVDAFTYLPKK